MQGAGADSKWVLTQGIANISTSAGYQAEWSTLFAALDARDPPDDRRVRDLPRQIQAGLTAGALK
jgi:N-acetylglucosamine transport system permease protein